MKTRCPADHQKVGGFSLFELVVFIISIAIIYAYAANRFADFPGQAERANFLAVSMQIQSAVNLEMIFGLGTGRINSLEALEGANPMDLLLDPPSNYIGAFDVVDKERLPRRVWYFDRTQGELVYLVNDTTGVFEIVNGVSAPTDEIRFKIMLDSEEKDLVTGLPVSIAETGGSIVPVENRRSVYKGAVMRPTIPYRWREAGPEEMIAATSPDNSG